MYGSLNGVLGLLNEDFIDLAAESQQVIRGLRFTPGAALGTCRTKLKKAQDVERVLAVFKEHNIRFISISVMPTLWKLWLRSAS